MAVAAYKWEAKGGKTYTHTGQQLLDMAANDPFFPVPYPILRTMVEDEPRPGGISVTMLNPICLRCAVLQKYNDYVVDLTARWWAWRGTMFHSLMEKGAQRGAVSEVRFWADLPGLDGCEIHGKIDDMLVTPDGAVLRDWKFPKKLPRWGKPWDNHCAQVQDYRWLVNNAKRWEPDLGGVKPNELNINRLGVVYVAEDSVMPLEVTKSVQVANTSRSGTHPVRVPDVWPDEEVEALLVARYTTLQDAYARYEADKELPPMPPGFDYIRDWQHQWSPTAEMCVKLYHNGGGE